MKTREQDIEVVKNLNDREYCFICWSEDGGGEVHRIYDSYFLFIIPQYGGEPYYYASFSIRNAEQLVHCCAKLTT